jgi:hypothetical protein
MSLLGAAASDRATVAERSAVSCAWPITENVCMTFIKLARSEFTSIEEACFICSRTAVRQDRRTSAQHAHTTPKRTEMALDMYPRFTPDSTVAIPVRIFCCRLLSMSCKGRGLQRPRQQTKTAESHAPLTTGELFRTLLRHRKHCNTHIVRAQLSGFQLRNRPQLQRALLTRAGLTTKFPSNEKVSAQTAALLSFQLHTFHGARLAHHTSNNAK